MDALGVIRADSPGIDRERWIALIERHPSLVRPGPVSGFNPATKEPIQLRPRPDVAQIISPSGKIGMMYWRETGENEINVFGDRDAVEPIAQAIAVLLDARFVAD